MTLSESLNCIIKMWDTHAIAHNTWTGLQRIENNGSRFYFHSESGEKTHLLTMDANLLLAQGWRLVHKSFYLEKETT
jgi:hypothetical protein